MSRSIPMVRVWRAILADGRAFEVLAPTRYLAVLNLRATARNWGAIVRLSLLHRPRPPFAVGVFSREVSHV